MEKQAVIVISSISEVLTVNFVTATAAVVVAGLMRGFAGFGSGMVMAPVFAILFGPVETVAMVIMLEIAASIQLTPKALPYIQWRFVGLLSIIAVLFMPLGTYFLGTVNPQIMTRLMAGIVLVFVLVLMIGWRYEGRKRLLPTLLIGATSGALMAATSMGNPPVLLYMLSGRESATTNRANIIGYFAITQVALLLILLILNLLSWPPVIRAAMLTPPYLLAAWCGSQLFRQSNEILYRRIALNFLFVVAAYGLLR